MNPVTPISVQYDLTPRERKEGRSVLMRPGAGKQKGGVWKSLIGWVLFLGLAVVFFLMMVRNKDGRVAGPPVQRPAETAATPAPAPPDDGHWLRLIAMAVCVGGAVVFVAVLWVSFLLARREQRRRDSGAGRRHRTMYTFGEDALVETAGAKTTFLYWPAFHSFAETERLFVIRNNPDEGPVIPKRLFTSAAEVGRVRELLVRKLTPPPLPQNSQAPQDPPAPPSLTTLEGS